jgi:hypothetical protein
MSSLTSGTTPIDYGARAYPHGARGDGATPMAWRWYRSPQHAIAAIK